MSNGANDGQGNTGAGNGNGDGNDFLNTIQNEELRGNESLKDFKDIDTLAQSYIDTKSAVPVIPENVDGYDFKIPEGIEIDEEQSKAFKEFALKEKFTNDQCQAVIEFDYARQKKIWDQLIAQKDEAVKKLKEERGDKYDQELKLCQKVLKTLGGENLAQRVDLGNDPDMFRFLVKVGGALSEDTINAGGQEGGGDDRPTTDDGRPMLDFPDMD